MKTFHNLLIILLKAVICFIIGACSEDEVIESEQKQTRHTIKMHFIGDIIGFAPQTEQSKVKAKASSSSPWVDGDKIYITFYNGNTIVPGEAIYDDSSGWSVSYDGNLPETSAALCEARYFVNASFSSASLVSLNPNSVIYEDLNGIYAYSNGSLTVQATLSPKTGRLRFTGDTGAIIHTTGISTYTTFSPAINKFSSSKAMITSTVEQNGSTPYIYGKFSDDDRNIGLVGSDFAYTRSCSSEMLKAGESGYMAIPSEKAHNNWRRGLYIKANNVEFKMIPVAGYSGGFFLIGETEVTEELYNSLLGKSSGSLLPISNIYYSEATAFIEKLNNTTMLSFKIPSAAEWQYAAKGGQKSQGYTYSGSNTPGDVAWYSTNTSSKQNVKTKAPNELGIYDMSGNVGEFVTDTYSNNYNYVCGGCYKSSPSYIESTSKTHYYDGDWESAGYDRNSVNRDIGAGFRLILICP